MWADAVKRWKWRDEKRTAFNGGRSELRMRRLGSELCSNHAVCRRLGLGRRMLLDAGGDAAHRACTVNGVDHVGLGKLDHSLFAQPDDIGGLHHAHNPVRIGMHVQMRIGYLPHNKPVEPFSCLTVACKRLHSTGPLFGQINPQ
ncbi:hypothetical protein [Xanthomonas oryzae]